MSDGFGKLDWGQWLYGLFSGFIGGGASAATSGFVGNAVDPTHFNVRSRDFYILIGANFMASGLLSMFFYLKQHPLPEMHVVERTVLQTTETMTTTTSKDQPKNP